MKVHKVNRIHVNEYVDMKNHLFFFYADRPHFFILYL